MQHLTHYQKQILGNFRIQCRKSSNPQAAARLHTFMSLLSEEMWFAGWRTGCEELFWAWLHDDSQTALDPDDKNFLAELAHQCEGWWMWGDTDYPTFVKTKVWEAYLWN
ncbi:MAG TPA: hypothetical protein V6D27_00840 [Vampirovibrionales bacterium]